MINVEGVHPSIPPQSVEPTAPVAPDQPVAASQPADVVEISSDAQLAAKVQELPDVRPDVVARVKAEIEAGTYETPERIEVTVDRLMEDLFPNS